MHRLTSMMVFASRKPADPWEHLRHYVVHRELRQTKIRHKCIAFSSALHLYPDPWHSCHNPVSATTTAVGMPSELLYHVFWHPSQPCTPVRVR